MAMAQAFHNFQVSPSSLPISKTIINHSHSLKNPSLNSRRRLLINRIRCSASPDGAGNTLIRTCKNCKTQFDPMLNHPRACRFHTAHFGGETKRKFESVYSGGTMDTPNSGKVLQYWHCCGSEDPFDPVLVVDRLKTDPVKEDGASESVTGDICKREFVQCRICHDEDEDSNMDTPCSCSGTLKFAHHHCIQRWCNEKGDTLCEICRRQYKSGYTAPRQLFHYTGISMNYFRSDWGIEALDLRNPYFLTDDHELYSFHSPTSLICCRVIALLFIFLLFLRHSLPVFLGGINDFSLSLLLLPLLKTLGILLVAYFFFKSFVAIQRCRQEWDTRFSGFSSDEETAPPPRIFARTT